MFTVYVNCSLIIDTRRLSRAQEKSLISELESLADGHLQIDYEYSGELSTVILTSSDTIAFLS